MVHVSVFGEPGAALVVAVRGNLDLDSVQVLNATLDNVLERPSPRVVVDLSGIEFCDSMALSAFVIGHNRARAAGGWVRLAAPTAFVERLLGTVGLTNRIGVYPTVADALADRSDGARG